MKNTPQKKEPFHHTMRALVECYRAFERNSTAKIRTFGLTSPQFDILATLGNTPGMTFKELGTKTLITKGTLTGVIDRLEERRYVERIDSKVDGRSTLVRLTKLGQQLFVDTFPEQMAHLEKSFTALTQAESDQLVHLLEQLGDILQRHTKLPKT
jgi:MarR family transcriptional regulator, 2-MHQ and catechol-resistance regulon repressor